MNEVKVKEKKNCGRKYGKKILYYIWSYKVYSMYL